MSENLSLKPPYILLIISVLASIVGIGLLSVADSTDDGGSLARSAGVVEVIALIVLGISATWTCIRESVRGTYWFAGCVALLGVAYVGIAAVFGVNVHGDTAWWLLMLVAMYIPLAILVGVVAAIRDLSD
jgi:hypothetical protein